MKKYFLFSFLLFLILGQNLALASTNTSVFSDVPTSSPYYEALNYLKTQSLISGYADGSFKPSNSINRAEFTKIIVGAVSTQQEISSCLDHYVPQTGYTAKLFTDVKFDMVGGNIPVWYFDYVCLAKLKGLVTGYSDGSFRPEQVINFVEASKIITVALGYSTTTSSPWYKTYVQTLENKNAIPTTITTFNENITRGEMAEIIWRLKAQVVDLPTAHYSNLK